MNLGRGSYSQVEGFDYVTVGNYSSIAPEVYFNYSDDHLCIHDKKVVFTTNWEQPTWIGNPTIVGNDVWICRGAKILDGVKIGDGAIIGAWTVIGKDVPPYAVIVGNPQVIKRYRFTKEQIKKLLEIKWWYWDQEKIDEAKPFMKDIDVFLEKYGGTL